MNPEQKQPTILLILGPLVGLFPDLMTKKLNEIAIKMDKNWKLLAVTSYFTNRISLPCSFELHTVPMPNSSGSVLARIMYLGLCVFKGVELVKKENVDIITQHDGHLEYGIVAYVVSRFTHRKCLIRVNEDTLIPLLFFLKASGNFLFGSETVLKIVTVVYRKIEHTFFKHVDWILTHGPMDYRKIKEVTNKVTFVPLWVDTKRFQRLDKMSSEEFRQRFTADKSMKIILFIGRLHPEKGVDTLLKALKMMQDKEILLLIVYSVSEYKETYENLAETLGISNKILFISYIPHDDLPRYYCVADAYVLPSMREEWSNTLMEAMACETPVIATNVGANPYQVVEGKTGFLVPPNDPRSLAQKMQFVLENPDFVRRVAQAAVKEVRKYDKEKIGNLYKIVVISLLKKGGSEQNSSFQIGSAKAS